MGRRVMPLPTAIAPAGGGVTVQWGSSGLDWVVQQVSTECSAAPVGATSRLYHNGTLISKMLPAGDVASGDPPVPLNVGENMSVVWTGLTPGAACKVTVIFDDGM